MRTDRCRVYARLMLQAQGRLSAARVRLARSELFVAGVMGGVPVGGDCCLRHWRGECERWLRVRAYLHRRRQLVRAFGV